MREVLLLRGHEHEVTTMCWHPFHSDLISTGSSDGSIHHYLLDEPNTPQGTSLASYPYDTPDPLSASTQTIYPAHRIPYAHESHVWSLDWHPLGHILASGSNDKVTRFWTRPRPGDEAALSDRYHIGQAAAAAAGYGQTSTWQSRGEDVQDTAQAEEDAEDAEDEEDALVDQTMPARQLIAPGLQSLATASNGSDPTNLNNMIPQLPGMASALPSSSMISSDISADAGTQRQMLNANGDHFLTSNYAAPMAPIQQPNLQLGNLSSGAALPSDQLSKLFERFKQGHLQHAPPGQTHGGQQPPFGGAHGSYAPPQPSLPFPLTNEKFPPPTMDAGTNRQQTPGYSQHLQQLSTGNERPGSVGADASAVRRRTPLPSQEDSLKQEQLRGKYRGVR